MDDFPVCSRSSLESPLLLDVLAGLVEDHPKNSLKHRNSFSVTRSVSLKKKKNHQPLRAVLGVTRKNWGSCCDLALSCVCTKGHEPLPRAVRQPEVTQQPRWSLQQNVWRRSESCPWWSGFCTSFFFSPCLQSGYWLLKSNLEKKKKSERFARWKSCF